MKVTKVRFKRYSTHLYCDYVFNPQINTRSSGACGLLARFPGIAVHEGIASQRLLELNMTTMSGVLMSSVKFVKVR